MNGRFILIGILSLVSTGCGSKSETTITYDTASSQTSQTNSTPPPPQPGEMLAHQQAQQAQQQQQQPAGGQQEIAQQPPQAQIANTMDPATAAKMPEMPKSTPSPEQYPTDPPKLPPASALKRHGDTIISPTGLKYIDFKTGEGEPSIPGDFISVSYVGRTTDGKEFDRSTSFTTQVGMGSLIPGWDEGGIGMRKGGKRRLIIPGKLGARAVAKGDVIPLNRTIIYDIDMILIQK